MKTGTPVTPKKSFSFTLPRIRLGEFDLGGVLYHANYYHLYEMAREAFLQEHGLPYSKLVDNSQHLTVIESHQFFSAPITYGDPIKIELFTSGVRKTSATFHYSIHCGGQVVHAAWTRHAFVSIGESSIKVRRFPEKLQQLLEEYEAE